MPHGEIRAMATTTTRRRIPLATLVTLAVTAPFSVLQFPFPVLLASLRRDPGGLAAGQWWRLVTPLVVQDGGVLGTISNLAFLAVLGTLAERRLGAWRWVALYLLGGAAGEAAGYAWEPHGAGNSVALCGLAGAILAIALLRPAEVRPPELAASAIFAAAVTGLWYLPAAVAAALVPALRARPLVVARVAGALSVFVAAALLARRDLHGAALAAGLATGPLVSRR
jgi:membrane associated rhomboid family serine protease